jgi:signal transduction histidine kinase
MKLLNYTLLFLSATLFAVVGLWAVIFYFQLLKQVKTTLDEGLSNNKILIIDKLKDDVLPADQNTFGNKNYTLKEVDEEYAIQVKDSYKDTSIFSELKNLYEQTRMLTTAFVAENGQYYEMKVISQELDRGKLIKQVATWLLWLYFFLFVSIILINNFVLKKTWKPFYQLLKYLEDFRLEKESLTEPAKTKIKEFAALNKTVLKLLNANVETYTSQKQFIENASHEMQTPLAIGINKLELLAGSDGLSAEHIQKIGSIIQTFQRLAGFNKSLLLLTKIENNQFISKELVNFDEILGRIINDFSDYTTYRKIEIKYLKEESWFFRMNKDLAEILSMNLIKNAIVHNIEGGEVIVKISASGFSVENTSDVPEMATSKLFDRFNKTPEKKGSTGLGLAIVKAITNVSGLNVNYSWSGKHNFIVTSKPE